MREARSDGRWELQAPFLSGLSSLGLRRDGLKTDGVRKKVKELGMCLGPGPAVPGYIDSNFQDSKPSGPEKVVQDKEWEGDLARA